MGPPLVHFTPIAPALGGNGLAMRVGIFADALSQISYTISVSVGDSGVTSWVWSGHGGRCFHVETSGRGDTPLHLISSIKDIKARCEALRGYGRPMTSHPLSGPVVKEAIDHVGSGSIAGILVSRARVLPILELLPREWQAVPVIVDLDDDDAALCRERAVLARAAGEDVFAELMDAEADAYDTLILRHVPRVSKFVCASEAVAKSLQDRLHLADVAVICNGIAQPSVLRGTQSCQQQNLIFVGNLSYDPNIDGVAWFLNETWPLVRQAIPEARFKVVGSNPSHAVLTACAAPGVDLYADPDTLDPLYADASVAVIPLRLGSGSRIKILEAGMFGLPVVSTPKGAEGLDADLIGAITLAETPADMALACAEILRTGGDGSRLQRLVLERHERSRVVSHARQLLERLI